MADERTEAGTQPEVRYGGFWRRLAAALVDGVLLTALQYGLAFGIGGLDAVGFVAGAGFADPVTWLGMLFQWAYFFLFTWLYGATVGKMMLGLKVVKLVKVPAGESAGAGSTDSSSPSAYQPVDWLTVLFREVIGKTLSTLGLGLGYLWAAFHPKKQGWHDLIADTVVIRVPPGHRYGRTEHGPAS